MVGAGNSAVQVGYELPQVATVTLATRHPVTFRPQCRDGQDMHYWLKTTGFDLLPPEWLRHYLGGRTVVDTGKYQHAVATGQLDRRPMFTAFGRDHVIWPDGTREKVDTVVFATGYRPHLDYLSPLGALDGHGMPRHTGGISATHPGLVYLGLEFQRSFSSNTLRGVYRDAEHVITPLAAHVRKAPAAARLNRSAAARRSGPWIATVIGLSRPREHSFIGSFADCRASAILARAQRREVRPNIWASLRSDSGLPAFTLSRYAATAASLPASAPGTPPPCCALAAVAGRPAGCPVDCQP